MTEDEIDQKTTPAAVTTMIDTIIEFGNRGHWFGFDPRDHTQNLIECVDGFQLSVIAGAGTYSIPTPAICTCALYRDGSLTGEPFYMSVHYPWEVEHDYRGPYAAVEVMIMSDEKPGPEWDEYDNDAIYARVPVALVRHLIIAHGGEIEKPDHYYRGTNDV